jgi:hypothetical protein
MAKSANLCILITYVILKVFVIYFIIRKFDIRGLFGAQIWQFCHLFNFAHLLGSDRA